MKRTKKIGRVEERNESAWYGRRNKVELHTEEVERNGMLWVTVTKTCQSTRNLPKPQKKTLPKEKKVKIPLPRERVDSWKRQRKKRTRGTWMKRRERVIFSF